jgi:hypothetical protein
MSTRAIAQSFARMTRSVSGRPQGPVRARVLKQESAGGLNCVDVEVLRTDDSVDPNWPPIRRIECPVWFSSGAGTGVYVKIKPGTVVRVAFYEFDRHRPYLDSVIGSSFADNAAEFVIKAGGATVTVSGGQVRIDSGTVVIATGSWCHLEAGAFLELYGDKVQLGSDGANQRIIRGDDFITALVAKINSATTFGGSPIDAPWTEAEFQSHLSAKVETV